MGNMNIKNEEYPLDNVILPPLRAEYNIYVEEWMAIKNLLMNDENVMENIQLKNRMKEYVEKTQDFLQKLKIARSSFADKEPSEISLKARKEIYEMMSSILKYNECYIWTSCFPMERIYKKLEQFDKNQKLQEEYRKLAQQINK